MLGIRECLLESLAEVPKVGFCIFIRDCPVILNELLATLKRRRIFIGIGNMLSRTTKKCQ